MVPGDLNLFEKSAHMKVKTYALENFENIGRLGWSQILQIIDTVEQVQGQLEILLNIAQFLFFFFFGDFDWNRWYRLDRSVQPIKCTF